MAIVRIKRGNCEQAQPPEKSYKPLSPSAAYYYSYSTPLKVLLDICRVASGYIIHNMFTQTVAGHAKMANLVWINESVCTLVLDSITLYIGIIDNT